MPGSGSAPGDVRGSQVDIWLQDFFKAYYLLNIINEIGDLISPIFIRQEPF